MRAQHNITVKAFTRTLALAVALAATAAPAFAQTTTIAPSTAARPETVNLTVAAPQPAQATLATYRNADALHGIYTRPAMIAQCADRPVTGPLPNPATGSLEAQPGYNFLMDFDLAGACRKAF